MPILQDTAQSEEASSGEKEEEDIVTISDPFLDAECKEIKFCKKLRRGLQYLKSGYVRNVQDSLPDRAHLYRASVRASMVDKAYTVKVALSQVSGSVIKCCCDVSCPQKSLGRCSHISALLLFILLHKNLEGPEGKFFLYETIQHWLHWIYKLLAFQDCSVYLKYILEVRTSEWVVFQKTDFCLMLSIRFSALHVYVGEWLSCLKNWGELSWFIQSSLARRKGWYLCLVIHICLRSNNCNI